MDFRWTIFTDNLNPVVGSEQGKTRPVLVISQEDINQILPVINILPITTRKKGRNVYANEVLLPPSATGLYNESIVLCYQVRTLDKSRLQGNIGRIEDEALQNNILAAMRFQLGL